ncbi:uncharacterized protein CBL_14377 [Carabus blaptoides fortunei]
MKTRLMWSSFLYMTSIFFNVHCLEETNWVFHFPQGTTIGIFAALAVPVDIPNKSVYVAYNFEANYGVPGNETTRVEFPPLLADEVASRSAQPNISNIDRSLVYQVLESKLNKYGYKGQSCLFRAICESAMSSFVHNGVLGDIMHIIFTPSSSKERNYPSTYFDAEANGKHKNNCIQYYKNCSISLLDMIS